MAKALGNNRNVGLADVARLSGVSIPVVSCVLSGGKGSTRYSATTAERVRRIARSIHYRPRLAARMIRQGRTGILGSALPSTSWAYAGLMLPGCINAAVGRGYQLIVTMANYRHEDYLEQISHLLDRDVDGLVLFASDRLRQSDIFQELVNTRRSVVFIEHDPQAEQFDFVGMDDAAGYRLAVSHLRKLGHQRIGLLYEQEATVPSAHQRRIDFEQVIDEQGLPVLPRNYLAVSAKRSTQLDQYLDRICADRSEVTALVVRGHARSVVVHAELAARGLCVPRDLSLFSISSWNYQDARLRFDSVRNAIPQIGAQAVELLIERIHDPDRPARRVRLAGELVAGETCGRPGAETDAARRGDVVEHE